MSIPYSERELDSVFGSGSTGRTPEERAKTSQQRFVRSQIQLAPYSEGAKGRILNSIQAFRLFGWEILHNSMVEGSASLIRSPNEPSATLRERREELGISVENLAKRVRISSETLSQLESRGKKSPIRIIETVAQALALDERKLGFVPNAGRDAPLGVRLREMARSGDIAWFSANTVLQLAEAAWIISRQTSMQSDIGSDASPRVRLPRPDVRFSYPAYEIGYSLARKTRALLGIDEEAPVTSVRKLIEDDFGLSLVQQQMNQRFAGATIANGGARGIVVNETGMNSNVWVRRMTLCHELGHLLWDPDDRLHRVTVDAYSDIELSDRDSRRDAPEIRANAFAVAFLAPPAAVLRIAQDKSDAIEVVREVMRTFGISATAARHHVKNVTKLDSFGSRHEPAPEPDANWIAMENLMLDYFPIKSTPLSRRGKFAWYVAKLFDDGQITLDTAASYLAVTATELTESALRTLLELRGGSPAAG